MPRALHVTALAALVAFPVVGAGCVPQDRYDQLLMTNRRLEEQVVRAESERDTARANLRSAQGELGSLRGDYDSLDGKYSSLNQTVDSLASENNAYLDRISQLQIGPLPADMESALESLSRSHPDVLAFDARRGMLRFSSDFTFGLGSAQLTPDARRTLEGLAPILTGTSGRGFEVQIVGHTDTVPISRPQTRQQHPTNTHLSVHRSIAVRDALVNAGVEPVRIAVTGYGEHRPAVPNGRGGAPQNRRVEIYLKPMPDLVVGAPTTSVPDSAPSAGRPAAVVEPIK